MESLSKNVVLEGASVVLEGIGFAANYTGVTLIRLCGMIVYGLDTKSIRNICISAPSACRRIVLGKNAPRVKAKVHKALDENSDMLHLSDGADEKDALICCLACVKKYGGI